MYSLAENNKKEDDFLQISGLKRSDWKIFWHPNSSFLRTLEESGIQAYILEGTIYGCFVNKKLDSKVEVQWFGYYTSYAKDSIGKIVPSSTLDLYKILEMCDPIKVEGLLFNLDILN